MIGGRTATLRYVAVAAAVVVVVLWCGGLVWFVRTIPTAMRVADTDTDAIVVLTGGSQRIETGLALLAAGRAKMLFISGVHHGVGVNDILRLSGDPPARLRCCIALGHHAESTRGNALETAVWMRARSFHSLQLVTANYHMPRSLLEFARAMPGAVILPHPVFPILTRGRGWWLKPPMLWLVLAEYDKYLVALARPLLPIRPAAAIGARL